MTESPQTVLVFWCSLRPEDWFNNGKLAFLDDYIRYRFSDLHRDALEGKLSAWEETPDGQLALIILFDQFSRHMYRHDPSLFYSSDEKARQIARKCLEAGIDLPYNILQKFFFFPFLHSENIQDILYIKECATKRNYTQILVPIERNLEILSNFGRYPFRNAFLSRETTRKEFEWLCTPEGYRRLRNAFPRYKLDDFFNEGNLK